jgi:hypothetical protein
MAVLAVPLFTAAVTTGLTVGITQAITPDLDDPDVPEAEESGILGSAADDEARRRAQSSSQLINPGAVGQPGLRTGTPSLVGI